MAEGTGLVQPREEMALENTYWQPYSAREEIINKMKPGSSGEVVGRQDVMGKD